MSALLDVILPVFLLIGFGYAAARFGVFSESNVDGVKRYAQSFALPVLLFKSIAALDLSQAYNPGLMLSFYAGAFAGFGFAFTGARVIFKRPLTDSVAIGFAGLFSNTLLLGLPITERAYGSEALAGNYAIISIHAPMLYTFGILMMEWARSRGQVSNLSALLRDVGRGVITQPLVIGILSGFFVNLSGINLPVFAGSAVEMMARSGIPAALFGLGGVLFRYRPEGDKATIAMVCAASLLVHPGVSYSLAHFGFGLDTAGLRSVTVTAAMAPGVNAYMFANMYGVGKRVAASSVLIATALSIFTTWGWLHLLP
jgi:malonate transporter and related proteins